MFDAGSLLAAIDWTALTLGIVAGVFAAVPVVGAIVGFRRQYSGSVATASGDGLLGFGEAFMKLQQDGYTKLAERCAVLESKVDTLEATVVTERTARHSAEMELATERALRTAAEQTVAQMKAERA